MLQKYKYHIWLHITVLIFGLTGVLGKLITVGSYLLVWHRVGIALVGIALYFLFSKHSFKIDRKNLNKTLLIGLIIALHWVTFFEAIKQSNVSIALICFSTGTLFTSLLEPIYFKRKIKPYEVIFGCLIIAGLSFIFSFEIKYKIGIALSIFSAFLSSWFTVLNGMMIKKVNSKTLSFYELVGAFLVVTVFLLVYNEFDITQFKIPVEDIKWLIVLGLLCTAFAFIVSVDVMKKISPYTVVMSVNLEPIYSVIIALIIWPESEKMSYGFYMGSIIVIATIFLNGMVKNRMKKSIT